MKTLFCIMNKDDVVTVEDGCNIFKSKGYTLENVCMRLTARNGKISELCMVVSHPKFKDRIFKIPIKAEDFNIIFNEICLLYNKHTFNYVTSIFEEIKEYLEKEN